ncbi:SusD/RagB family nutrient-binding outer membrane lipoprotein [Pedobacter heparinus]|uniref:SusD/RagB family nutrient-binding outer membrane lipoprotein n=1 Tax=Pedobacter heparinus TaxID=984 RepID=UPI002931DABE|nr:SusD/RagB family nutrient-binding outer membrane lipoprotein [Pedobacter heparinus]
MNTIKRYKIVLILCLILMNAAGCKKFLDINKDPSDPQIVRAEFLLSRLIFQMANGTSQDYMQLMRLTQNFTNTDANDLYERHGFPASPSDVTGVIWRMNYADFGLNIEDMIKDGIENKKYEYVGIGYALKAWGFQMTTDMYGDIILDEAFKINTLTFRYQSQKEVYERVREWSNLAIKYLNMQSPLDYKPALAGASGDFMYRGDMNKWKKFVYGNLALHYNHLVNKPNYASTYADSVLKYVELSFINTSEDATVKFTASGSDDANVLGADFGYVNNMRISKTILSLLTGGVRGEPTVDTTASKDPRLARMLTPAQTTATSPAFYYRGNTPTKGTVTVTGVPGTPFVLGTFTGNLVGGYPGKYIFSNTSQYPIMSFAQLQFAKAEALFLKGDKQTALTTYQGAIRAHMSFVNTYGNGGSDFKAITPAEIEPYMTSAEVAQNISQFKMSDIMNQKYIAQWGWAGLEQWCDLRKYHYDPAVFTQYYQLTGSEFAPNNGGKYAYRYRPRYNSEYIWNKKEIERIGGLAPDYNTKETWFSTAEN